MKNRSAIFTSALALCGIIGIYVATTQSLHDNETGPENSLSEQVSLNNTATDTSKDTQYNLNNKNAHAPISRASPKTQAQKTQADPGLARPTLADIRSLDILDKLNSFDGSENENLRLAFALNEDYDFQPIQGKQDRKGNHHTRYQQTYRGVPVWGEQVLIHQGTVPKGAPRDYYSANGKVARGFEFSELDHQLANIDRSEDTLREVIRSAKETNQHLSAQWSTRNAKSELVIYVNEQDEAIPAYVVSYLAMPRAPLAKKAKDDITLPNAQAQAQTPQQQKVMEMVAARQKAIQQKFPSRHQDYHQKKHSHTENAQPTRPHMLIDATTNQVIKQWEGLNTAEAHGPGGNEKTGRYEYGTDYPALLVSQAGDTCTLNNHKVKTVDLQHDFFLDDKAHFFPCAGNKNENNHKEINGAYSPLNDAHFFGGLVFDMFQEWFYLAPLNFQLTMMVHYDRKYNNAFWTGSEMVFGDGFNRFYPLVDVNVSAHEVAHGFTEQNSALIYSEESGGINEAFSDIAGEAAEFYWKGEVDWTVGADIFIGEASLRYFADPTLDGVSIGHADDFYPGIDVHYSSGVYNRAFYLLANTTNWDVRKAFEVFVLANQFYWEPNETYIGGACGVLSAANDLGFEVRDVDDAFQTVGVNCGSVRFTDSDRDGMDNLWEMRFNLNPRNPNDANMDADGDGLRNIAEYHERTNPQNADSDGDGINDLLELYVHKTNPNLSDSDYDGLDDYEEHETWLTDPAIADTDADGMPDGWEVKFGLAPRNPDAGNDLDGDGVSNLDEFTHRADPTLVDTDGDGLEDYAEINTHLTAANLQDSDKDGLMDADELERGTDPTTRDSDNDYLGDAKEIELGTDPLNPDADNDTLPDGDEISLWLTDPNNPDTDADGMPDGWEVSYNWFEIALNPRVADGHLDWDEDGLSNLQEYEFGVSPIDPDGDNDGLNDYTEIFESKTDPLNPDTDGDNLSDSWEFQMGLDPLNIEDAHIDSDGDGWLNKQEFELGTHPLSATEALDGLPARPRAADGASIAAEKITSCSSANLSVSCSTSAPRSDGFSGAYGWLFGSESNQALIFNSFLPWSIESVSFSISATAFTEDGRELIEILTLVDEDLPLSTSLVDLEAEEYWNKIVNGPQLATLSIPPSEVFPPPLYETTRFDLPYDRLDAQPIVIGRHISNLQKTENGWELIIDDFSHLNVTFAADTDDDGITDDWELLNGLDPANPADALEDRDEDGATNLQESLFRTNLDNSDSDGDGIADGWEIRYGLDPLTDDSLLDTDNDGLSNLAEFTFQTSPLKTDSDGDGIDDKRQVELRMSAEYDEQFQTPVCHTANALCSSGNLLAGRGEVNVKPEINSPNTLYGACPDGSEALGETALEGMELGANNEETENNGIESITISSIDLLPLGAGKNAEISVVLNASILHEDNYVDIFYTTDIEQAQWTLLESFRLTAQAQATNEYFLPMNIPNSEQDKHAIRAIYRYGGSALACSEGDWVDHDDLVFTVLTDTGSVQPKPLIRWSGLTDWNGPISLHENTSFQAIALDSQNVDRVLIEIVEPAGDFRGPRRVFSQSFLSAPYAYNWTGLVDGDYLTSVTAIYPEGEIAFDELALVQGYRQPDYDALFSFPEVSLDSPTDGATVQGEVLMAISAFDTSGISHVMVEVLGEDDEIFFARTLFQVPVPPSTLSPSFNPEFIWDSSNVPAGMYSVRVTPFNALLNWQEPNFWNEKIYSIRVEQNDVSAAATPAEN